MTARAAAIGLVISFAICIGESAAQQIPPRDVRPVSAAPATASISGVITAAADGTPLRGVAIRITGAGIAREPRGAFTESDGRYEISGLPPGQYTLVASKVGFMTLTYGQVRSEDAGRSVEVHAAERVPDIDFVLPRGAVITVKLLDALGDPVPAYHVAASQRRFSGGDRKLVQVINDSLMVTDDRGEVRLSGLGPGDYFVSTVAGPAITAAAVPLSMRAYQGSTFYPGVSSETDAQPVSVGLGDEVFVSMQLAGARTARVSGQIVGRGERPTLRLERRGIGGSMLIDATVSADGKSFAVAGLAPADYVLTARSDKEIGMLRFQLVGEDVSDLVVEMQPALTLRGRFTFEGGAPKNLAPASLVLRPVMTETRLQLIAQIKNDFTFELPEANGTGVLRLEQAPRDWYLKAVRVEGRDITDATLDLSTLAGKPLEVVLTQQSTELSGRVLDSRGRPPAAYVVVLFPEDRQQWTALSRRIIAARPDQTGGYTIRGLPDGRYLAAAVDFLPPGEERDPKVLERLQARATAVTLRQEQPAALDLALAP